MSETELIIIEFDNFDAAFPVKTGEEEATRRRFYTLFVHGDGRALSGAMGMVFKAKNSFGEVFAIKRLKLSEEELRAHELARSSAQEVETELPDDELTRTQRLVRGRIAAFQEEYRVQLAFSRLKGFPKVYGMGYENGLPVIVMEWVEGITLSKARTMLPQAQKIAPSAAPAERSIGPTIDKTIVAQLALTLFGILSGVENMREQSAHRDISPNNIMIRTGRMSLGEQIEQGEFDLCLIDFGSATSVEENAASFTMSSDIWRNGTPEYAPPEMLTHDIANVMELRQSPSIDIYASCSILYELYAGHPPYCVGDHKETSPYRLKVDNVAIPLGCLDSREQSLATIIMSGLATIQADRPTAATLYRQIKEWLASEKSPSSQNMKENQDIANIKNRDNRGENAPAAHALTGSASNVASQINTPANNVGGTALANNANTPSASRASIPSAKSAPVTTAYPLNSKPTPENKPLYVSASKRPAQPLVVRNNQRKSRRITTASVVVLAIIAIALAICAYILFAM